MKKSHEAWVSEWVSISWLNSAIHSFSTTKFNQIPCILSKPAAITAVNSTSDVNKGDKWSVLSPHDDGAACTARSIYPSSKHNISNVQNTVSYKKSKPILNALADVGSMFLQDWCHTAI